MRRSSLEEQKPAAAANGVIEIELKGAKPRVLAGTRPGTIVALVNALRSAR